MKNYVRGSSPGTSNETRADSLIIEQAVTIKRGHAANAKSTKTNEALQRDCSCLSRSFVTAQRQQHLRREVRDEVKYFKYEVMYRKGRRFRKRLPKPQTLG
jgi:hypothetical protein